MHTHIQIHERKKKTVEDCVQVELHWLIKCLSSANHTFLGYPIGCALPFHLGWIRASDLQHMRVECCTHLYNYV